MEQQLNSYELSRKWFNYSFDNPEKVKPVHSAIYFFAIEHCNRLGWKQKFGFPSQMVMEAIGIKNWRTYSKALNDLVAFGFIEMIEISKNQYSSNIIAIVKNTKAPTKALDKALQSHCTKQGQSTVSIDKQLTTNKEQRTIILDYLNLKNNSTYRSTSSSTIKLLNLRMSEGFTVEDFKKVIDNKVAEWKEDSNMSKFLRPETLFGNKFDGYLNQKPKYQGKPISEMTTGELLNLKE